MNAVSASASCASGDGEKRRSRKAEGPAERLQRNFQPRYETWERRRGFSRRPGHFYCHARNITADWAKKTAPSGSPSLMLRALLPEKADLKTG